MNLRVNDEIKWNELKIDCRNCFGLCCVSLYFSKSEGFPNDKVAGKPCCHLKEDFGCDIHERLHEKGLKGCMAYDCLGAGQKIAQLTYKGKSWHTQLKEEMFEAFLKMRGLHEMLWYIRDARSFMLNAALKQKLKQQDELIEALTKLSAKELVTLDLEAYRTEVNKLLKQASLEIQKMAQAQKGSKDKKRLVPKPYYMGANLTQVDLIGADFAGCLLIAANLRNNDLSGANLIGADLRDANLKGVDLSNCLFLTQAQVNTAKGDQNTKLPPFLSAPAAWLYEA